mgnify:CR=1 FL=1
MIFDIIELATRKKLREERTAESVERRTLRDRTLKAIPFPVTESAASLSPLRYSEA